MPTQSVCLNDRPDRSQRRAVYALYRAAFPRSERKPFCLIRRKQKSGRMEMICLTDAAGAFVGEAITMHYRDMVLLDYFAIAPEWRGQGAGGAALAALQRRYGGKRFFLEIEDPAVPADNAAERQRRQRFYERCGMQLLPGSVMVFGTQMRLLTYRCTVGFDEYRAMYAAVFGERMARHVQKTAQDAVP